MSMMILGSQPGPARRGLDPQGCLHEIARLNRPANPLGLQSPRGQPSGSKMPSPSHHEEVIGLVSMECDSFVEPSLWHGSSFMRLASTR